MDWSYADRIALMNIQMEEEIIDKMTKMGKTSLDLNYYNEKHGVELLVENPNDECPYHYIRRLFIEGKQVHIEYDNDNFSTNETCMIDTDLMSYLVDAVGEIYDIEYAEVLKKNSENQ